MEPDEDAVDGDADAERLQQQQQQQQREEQQEELQQQELQQERHELAGTNGEVEGDESEQTATAMLVAAQRGRDPDAGEAAADVVLEQEALFSVGRMAEVLESGNDGKRGVVLMEMQQLLDHCLEDTLKILVPVLCLHVHEWVVDLQLAAAEALLDVVHKVIPADVAKMISAASFRVVKTATVDTVYESWGEILVAVLPAVSWSDEELIRVLALIDAHANRSSEVSRKLAARVVGAMSLCLEPTQVETHIMTRTLRLCADNDVEVRGMSTESLAFVGARVSKEVLSDQIWPQLARLLEDYSSRIRAATLRSIARILEAGRNAGADDTALGRLLAPVFLRHCQFARTSASEDQRLVDDDSYLLLEIFSEIFGELLLASSAFMPTEDMWLDAHKAYMKMSTCNGPVVRRHCAYNLPGVAQVMGSRQQNELTTVLEFLSRDPDPETRWNLAAGIHESMRYLLGKDSVEMLLKGFTAVLHDDNPLVRMNAVGHISEGIQCFVQFAPGFQPEKHLDPLFQNLSLLSEGNWRTQETLARQLRECSHVIPAKILRASVLPILYRMAEESTHCVRRASMEAVIVAIHNLTSSEQEEISNLFRIEWAQGGVFWMRVAYLDSARFAADIFSKARFQRLFARYALKLAGDPVSNVRLRLAVHMRAIAYACQDMPEFQSAMRSLQDDDDEDVLTELRGFDSHLRSIQSARAKLDTEDQHKVKLEDDAERAKTQDSEQRALRGPAAYAKSLLNSTGEKSTSLKKVVTQKARAPYASNSGKTLASSSPRILSSSVTSQPHAESDAGGRGGPSGGAGARAVASSGDGRHTMNDADAPSMEQVRSNHANLSSAVTSKTGSDQVKNKGLKKLLSMFRGKK